MSQYDVELDLSGTGGHYRLRTTVTFHSHSVAGLSTWLDLIAPSVTSITSNGRELTQRRTSPTPHPAAPI